MTESGSRQLRHRRVRLQRLNLAIFSWAVSFSLALVAWRLGHMSITLIEFGAIAVLLLALLLGFHVAIRTGWSERFRDPSLTLPHILIAVLIALYIIGQAGQARTIMLLLLMISMFFGVFQLRREEYALVALVAIVGYGVIVFDKYLGASGPGSRLLLLEFVVFTVVMGWVAFIGSYVANLRRKLSQRNRELNQASEYLRHLADHDELTGLSNRRGTLQLLERARQRAENRQQAFSVAVLDLDRFKRVNDAYGHRAGDQVLAEFARRTEGVLRDSDRIVRVDEASSDIGRFGGEEFLAVLGNSDLDGARLAAERLRESVAAAPFRTDAGDVDCTVSIGLTEYRPGEEVHRTVGRADEALYMAKENGRNRVETL